MHPTSSRRNAGQCVRVSWRNTGTRAARPGSARSSRNSAALRLPRRSSRDPSRLQYPRGGEHATSRAEPKVANQAPKPTHGRPAVHRMPETVDASHGKTRLAGIHLPRMQVDHRRLVLTLVDPSDRPSREAVRKQPEIPATRHRDAPPRTVTVESGSSAISVPEANFNRCGE